MQATEKYYLEDEEENERERSERERKELLKKEAENIAIDLTLKRVRFRQYHSDRQLEKEIISLEKKWEHMRQKYERSLKEIRRFEEEKAKNDHSAEQKKRLADIDKELQELAEENERFKAEGWLSTPEKDTAEKEAQEKGLFDDVQERIKGIIGRVTINCSKDYLMERRYDEEIQDDMFASVSISGSEEVSLDEIMDVRDALKRLDDEHREVIELYYFNQLSVSEIASMLQKSVNTVKSQLRRGREKLRTMLA